MNWFVWVYSSFNMSVLWQLEIGPIETLKLEN
jgi:hypothetical protein